MSCIVTAYQHSSDNGLHLPCDNANIEVLIQQALSSIGCSADNVINVQMDGPWGAGEWGVRVFCRKFW